MHFQGRRAEGVLWVARHVVGWPEWDEAFCGRAPGEDETHSNSIVRSASDLGDRDRHGFVEKEVRAGGKDVAICATIDM